MYKTYGQLSPGRDNALVVCHALTGNASLDSWWGTLLGPGKPFDTDRYFVVGAGRGLLMFTASLSAGHVCA